MPWACLLAVSTFAGAAELRVAALAVPYANPWQRATPQQEAEDAALLLDAPEVGLHLAVPRPTRALKTDAASYYARLSEKWRARYGDDARISWHESGGRKWLLCRRPSRDGGVSVFHLATVFEARAYSMLLFAPASAEMLPTAALDLLAAVRFGDVSAVANWSGTRVIYPKAGADVLEALARDDVSRLGDDGMVTGYGLDFGESSVDWFIEGYQWKTVNTRATRSAWKQGGRLEARAAADGAAWTLKLTLTDDEADVRAGLRVIDLCGPSRQVAEALDQLQHGARQPLRHLVSQRAAGCPEALAPGAPDPLPGESGKTVQANVALALPSAPTQLAAGLTRICLVEIALSAGPRRTGFGDRLLERARWYAVFEPAAYLPSK